MDNQGREDELIKLFSLHYKMSHQAVHFVLTVWRSVAIFYDRPAPEMICWKKDVRMKSSLEPFANTRIQNEWVFYNIVTTLVTDVGDHVADAGGLICGTPIMMFLDKRCRLLRPINDRWIRQYRYCLHGFCKRKMSPRQQMQILSSRSSLNCKLYLLWVITCDS